MDIINSQIDLQYESVVSSLEISVLAVVVNLQSTIVGSVMPLPQWGLCFRVTFENFLSSFISCV